MTSQHDIINLAKCLDELARRVDQLVSTLSTLLPQVTERSLHIEEKINEILSQMDYHSQEVLVSQVSRGEQLQEKMEQQIRGARLEEIAFRESLIGELRRHTGLLEEILLRLKTVNGA